MAQAQENSDLLERQAEVLKVHFYEANNGYAIVACTSPEFRAKNPHDQRGFTIKGTFPERPTPGTKYLIKGYATKDATRLGPDGKPQWYLKVKEAYLTGDRSADGWIEYLTREGPHLGDARATQLVEAFGNDVIQKMAESPANLANFAGITKERADELFVWAKQELHLASVKQWLYRQGLTPSLISKIICKHGHKTADVVKTDTYILTEIKGIGFKTADDVAMKIGLPKTNPRRILTGILYALQELLEQGGHTCVFHDRLTRAAQDLLDVPKELIISAYRDLVADNKICTQRSEIAKISTRPHLFEASLHTTA